MRLQNMAGSKQHFVFSVTVDASATQRNVAVYWDGIRSPVYLLSETLAELWSSPAREVAFQHYGVSFFRGRTAPQLNTLSTGTRKIVLK